MTIYRSWTGRSLPIPRIKRKSTKSLLTSTRKRLRSNSLVSSPKNLRISYEAVSVDGPQRLVVHARCLTTTRTDASREFAHRQRFNLHHSVLGGAVVAKIDPATSQARRPITTANGVLVLPEIAVEEFHALGQRLEWFPSSRRVAIRS